MHERPVHSRLLCNGIVHPGWAVTAVVAWLFIHAPPRQVCVLLPSDETLGSGYCPLRPVDRHLQRQGTRCVLAAKGPFGAHLYGTEELVWRRRSTCLMIAGSRVLAVSAAHQNFVPPSQSEAGCRRPEMVAAREIARCSGSRVQS